ncbi:hypothetical protein [Tritonibacter multivorans]|nr:hypothetical protein [Tritonibacter multivorans]MDA7419266.1 hypothetical protein [Tritonibacter multivorans]
MLPQIHRDSTVKVENALFLEEEGAGNVRQNVLRLALDRPKADAFQ